jgi:hypothetical protein
MNAIPLFHPQRKKHPGDRVKLPKHPASVTTTFWYGTIARNGIDIIWDDETPDHWDKTYDEIQAVILV